MSQWQGPSYIAAAPYSSYAPRTSVCQCSTGHTTPAVLGSPLQPSTPLSMESQTPTLDAPQDVSFEYFDAAVQYQNELCLSPNNLPATPTEEMVFGLGISFPQQTAKHGEDLMTPPTTPTKLPRTSVSESPIARRKWTADEDEALTEAVAKYATCAQKWKKVAAAVGNRHAKLCAKRWDYLDRTTMKGVKRGRWTYDEDVVLSQLVRDWTSSRTDKINWNVIATQLPRLRSGTQAQARYTETLDPSIKKGWWTPEEIMALQAAIQLYGTCWRQVAQEVPGRTQRQCRMRYLALAGTSDEQDEARCDSA
ncbi:hypothetical protein BCR37DRAFT_377234 [Protomyces lactucae-debilis]|uniref:Homeodomain-like protein n=1 Tax=Protomyces lactucae-debilis TaxID=2754530 RepID=A0A1Y2FNQ2_PROLT|nr:uncharacterized protein BCR37DRAFT_377234 [Protomyces lactucae-debilis]ORY85559.1 hypothetical protein BCR37DRAFT_377234 [Protomyces lactucae-debilis]